MERDKSEDAVRNKIGEREKKNENFVTLWCIFVRLHEERFMRPDVVSSKRVINHNFSHISYERVVDKVRAQHSLITLPLFEERVFIRFWRGIPQTEHTSAAHSELQRTAPRELFAQTGGHYECLLWVI